MKKSGKRMRHGSCQPRHLSVLVPAYIGTALAQVPTRLSPVARKNFTLYRITDWKKVITWLQPHLRPCLILALSGPLGAGKTTFVQHLAKQLGITKAPQSPTFSLLRTYRLPQPVNDISRLVHVDAYRIDDEKDLLPLDLDTELRDGKTVMVIEWPERIPLWIRRHQAILLRIQTR